MIRLLASICVFVALSPFITPFFAVIAATATFFMLG